MRTVVSEVCVEVFLAVAVSDQTTVAQVRLTGS